MFFFVVLLVIEVMFCFSEKYHERQALTLSAVYTMLSKLLKQCKKEKEKDKQFRPVLSWKQLYEAFARYKFPKTFPEGFAGPELEMNANALYHVIVHGRDFFPEEANAEILAYFLPGLSFPNHNECERCLGCLSMFLSCKHENSKNWMMAILERWNLVLGHVAWDNMIMGMIARFAKSQRQFDWTPYVERIFSCMLQRADVTLGASSKVEGLKYRENSSIYSNVGEKHGVASSFGKFVAHALRPRDDDPVFLAFEKFINTTKTYFHPSNSGRWVGSLSSILTSVPRVSAVRMRKEREKPEKYGSTALRPQDREKLVNLLLPVATYALWSKDDELQQGSRHTFKHMGYMCPDLVFPPLMERIYFALETVTETHQTTQALEILATVAHPLISKYKEGAVRHLVPFMQMAVPGIDPNDSQKTAATLKFFFSVLLWIPLYNEAEDDGESEELSENDRMAKQATEMLEDWAIIVWNQLVTYLSILSKEMPSMGQFWQLSTSMDPFFRLFFAQMSPRLRERFLKNELQDFIGTGSHIHADAEVETLIGCLVASDPENVLKHILPSVISLVMKDGKWLDASENTINWALLILGASVGSAGKYILPYLEDVKKVSEFSINYSGRQNGEDSRANEIRLSGTCMSDDLLNTLLKVRASNMLIVDKDKNKFKRWGQAMKREDFVKMDMWILPSADAIQPCVDWCQHFLAIAEKIVENGAQNTISDTEALNAMNIIEALIDCGAVFPFPDDEKDMGKASHHEDRGLPPYVTLHRKFGEFSEIAPLSFVLKRCRDLIFKLYEVLKTKRSDSADSFDALCKLIEKYLCESGGTRLATLSPRSRAAWKSKIQNYTHKHEQSRFMYLWRVQNYVQGLYSERSSEIRDTDQNRKMIQILLECSFSRYAVQRQSAQQSLTRTLNVFPLFAKEYIVPKVLEKLEQASELPLHELKGTLYLLSENIMLSKINRGYFIRPFLLALCSLHTIDDTKIQMKIAALFTQYLAISSLRPREIFIYPSMDFLPQSIREGAPVSETSFAKAMDYAKVLNEKLKTSTDGIVEDLLKLVEGQKAQNLHWKYELMVCCLLAISINPGNISPRVAKFFGDRLVSDVIAIRSVCQVTSANILKMEKKPRPYEMVERAFDETLDFETATKTGDFLDKPWHNFSPSLSFRHKKYAGLTQEEKLGPCSEAILENLKKENFLEKMVNFFVLERSSQAGSGGGGGRGGGKGHSMAGINSMLKKYGVSNAALKHLVGSQAQGSQGGGSAMQEVTTMIGSLRKGWPLTPFKAFKEFFSVSTALFWKTLFKCFGVSLLTLVGIVIEDLIGPTKRREEQVIAMEMLSGMFRATKHWTDADISKAFDWALPLLRQTLTVCSNDSHYDYITMIRFSVYHRDPRRLIPLVDMVFSLVEEHAANSSALSKSLHYVEALVIEMDWKIPQRCQKLVPILSGLVTHSYKQVRLACATSLMHLVCMAKNHPSNFPAFLDEMFGTGQDEKMSEEELSHKRDTLLAFLTQTIKRQIPTKLDMLAKRYDLILDFVLASHLDKEKDVQTLAKSLTPTCALLTFYDSATIDRFISCLERQISTNTSWKIRSSLPLVLTLFGFQHRFVKHKDLIPLVELLLADANVEVRQVSELALRSLLTGTNDQKLIADLDEKFGNASNQKVNKGSNELIQKVHAAVLGYAAIILSHPYDIPPHLPQLLMKFCRHSSDVNPIGQTVRTTMMEFWRTHHDSWDLDREKFDSDQLAVIRDLVISPSYYA